MEGNAFGLTSMGQMLSNSVLWGCQSRFMEGWSVVACVAIFLVLLLQLT